MQNIIVSDIFGRTEALEELASKFSAPTEILDPYSAKFMTFPNEQEAYAYFSEHITLEHYSNYLLNRIQSTKSAINLIGFSVGASAIWKISDNPDCINVTSAYCYYGSQIRNSVNIEPSFPISLTFPASESHFSVNELIDNLIHKNNVTIRRVSYLHGFMNIHSANYNNQGYRQEISALCEMPFNK
ncbi:dienelactone hydrolase family protein [Paraglaciecola aquimarina]|uniref:Dienelactone hydrolase family protein n=1 Tax=Paraglaciecola aquimarina TaxID=1235557 RepID=A0ABU3SUS3_9ALTE|nr:dienelactone hydrolase family protein [Paraglaciecola aquimarina]MDU0353749.1 dienelactone hydrolase family protein [Paraglaciecola aquimarina]